jgi:hypothetical protein
MLPKNLIDRFGVDGERFGQQPIRFGVVPLSLRSVTLGAEYRCPYRA